MQDETQFPGGAGFACHRAECGECESRQDCSLLPDPDPCRFHETRQDPTELTCLAKPLAHRGCIACPRLHRGQDIPVSPQVLRQAPQQVGFQGTTHILQLALSLQCVLPQPSQLRRKCLLLRGREACPAQRTPCHARMLMRRHEESRCQRLQAEFPIGVLPGVPRLRRVQLRANLLSGTARARQRRISYRLRERRTSREEWNRSWRLVDDTPCSGYRAAHSLSPSGSARFDRGLYTKVAKNPISASGSPVRSLMITTACVA